MDRSKWEYKKLSDVSDITMGQSPSSDSYNEDGKGLPFYQGNADFGDLYPTARVYCDAPSREADSDDILMSVRAPIGAINIANEHCCIGRGLCAIRPIPKVSDKMFLFYFLRAKNAFLNLQGTGSTFKSISKKVVYDLNVPMPSFADQQRIVAELDCLNEMIAVKQEQLKEFDKLAQSIFYDMFGRGLSQQQWDQTTIGEIAEEIKYGTSSPATPNGRYKYLRMNNMTNDGYLDLSDLKYIDVDDSNYEKYVVRKGDILFNRTNSRELVGKTALFDFEEEMIIAGYIIRVRLKSSANPCFVVRYMNLPGQKEYLRGLCRGAIGQANINAKELQAIPISLPPLSLQQQFAEKISAIEAQKELVKQSIAETQALLDYTMDKYFG